jgi:hypothetical protein
MLAEIILDVRKRNKSILKWLVRDSSNELCRQQSLCHPHDITLNHHPLSITHNRAWGDNLAPPPTSVPAKFRSSSSSEWDIHRTDTLESDLLPVVGVSLPTLHGVKLSANSTLAKLKLSHIGEELPPPRATNLIKFVQTPNKLIQMLQLATYKLNELHEIHGKRSGRLRLYNLSEFNCYSMGVKSSAPSLSELAAFMKITPVTLQKWFTIYKNALLRDFDFEKLGEEKIKDHNSFFYPEDERYQLSFLGLKSMEQYFQQIGKQLLEEAGNPSEDRSYVCDDIARTTQGPSVLHSNEMNQPVSSETCCPNNARRESSAVLNAGNSDQLLDTTSPFGRYFRINAACLAEMQSNDKCAMAKVPSIQLDRVPKRLKVGSKDRMLCMVLGCERHTQAQCNGCCSSHFRMLASTTALTTGKAKKVSLAQAIYCVPFVS